MTALGGPSRPEEKPPSSSSSNNEQEQQQQLTAEVAALRRRLVEIEARRRQVHRRRERVAAQREELRAWAAAWWGRVNAAEAALGRQQAALASAGREHARLQERLRVLGRTHVLDDAFFIWHSGPFATINGLRLGRLPAVHNVDWSDINGALGFAALLVATIAERTGHRFRQHQLLPMGSFAKVAAAAPDQPAPSSSSASTTTTTASTASSASTSLSLALPPPPSSSSASSSASSSPHPPPPNATAVCNLYFEDGFAFFRRQGFNRALQAFLRCVHELGEVAEKRDPALRLPYPIQGADGVGGGGSGLTVGGLPLVYAAGSEELWTRALKYAMTDVKWLVAWSAKHTWVE